MNTPTWNELVEGCEEQIDSKFGSGFSKKHPEILAQFINAAATHALALTIADSGIEALRESPPRYKAVK